MIAAGRQAIFVIVIVLLHLYIGDLEVCAWFGAVEILAVSVLLGTSFIDRFIKVIFPGERKIVPHYSKPVAILASFANIVVHTVL